jgi:hypothetical protein
MIDKHLEGFRGPKWHQALIRLLEAHKDASTLYYQCPQQCGDALFSSTRFAGQIAVAPELIFKLDDVMCVYKNMFNGDEWDRIQVSTANAMIKPIDLNLVQRKLPPGVVRGAAIFMSDATILSWFTGGVQVHALYMSLGNIDKSV